MILGGLSFFNDRDHPEHMRTITWARLEGFALDEPRADGEPVLTIAATRDTRPVKRPAAAPDTVQV